MVFRLLHILVLALMASSVLFGETLDDGNPYASPRSHGARLSDSDQTREERLNVALMGAQSDEYYGDMAVRKGRTRFANIVSFGRFLVEGAVALDAVHNLFQGNSVVPHLTYLGVSEFAAWAHARSWANEFDVNRRVLTGIQRALRQAVRLGGDASPETLSALSAKVEEFSNPRNRKLAARCRNLLAQLAP